MPPTKVLVAKPPTAETSQNLGAASIPVVVASKALSKWKGLGRCFSMEAGFVLARCTDLGDQIFSYCQRLVPCVLIADRALIESVDSAKFGDAVDFGRSIQVLVMIDDGDPRPVENLMRAGCMGLLQQGCSRSILRRAVRAVNSGEIWASRRLISRIFQNSLLACSPRKLTPREREILRLLGQGAKNREIAERLFISRETVRWHLRSLYGKIGVQDRLSAAFRSAELLAEGATVLSEPPKKPPEDLKQSGRVLAQVAL